VLIGHLASSRRRQIGALFSAFIAFIAFIAFVGS